MKVLLIFPPLRKEQQLNTTTVMPPLGIMTIAAVLENAGYKVEILDLNFLSRKGFSWEQLKESIKGKKPDMIGITCTTPAVINVLQIADMIKSINSKIFVAVGGPHASAMPRDLLTIGESIDVVVIGEGEYTSLELLKFLQNKIELEDIKGIAYREDGKIILTPARPYIENLDELPLPARHLFPYLNKYYFVGHCYNKLPVTSMITSRGCPHNCDFCTQAVFGRKYRTRSAEHVVAEMEELIKKYGIKSIMIVDDTFTLDKKRVYTICKLIRNKKLSVSWLCYAGIQEVDKDLLIEMKKAGCYQIYYGIESGSQKILNMMNKGITVEQIRSAVRDAKEAGLEVRGQFMFGYPSETSEEIKRTINFAKELDLDYAEFGITTPLPGSKLYSWAVSQGKFKLQNRHDFEIFREGTSIFLNPVVSLGEISKKELIKYTKKAYRDFYLRFNYLLKRFLKIKIRNLLTDVKKNLQAFFTITFGLSKFYKNEKEHITFKSPGR